MAGVKLASEKSRVLNSAEAVDRLFYGRGWTDGLPVVAPTEDRIVKMCSGTHLGPEDVIATIPPKWGLATVEKIAINCVMAGCLPKYMPVIITAIKAMSREEFNLYGVQATTHPVAPLLIVNGPIAKKLEMNSGYGAFGPGTRSNAAIGRAIRLILMNIGGAIPGRLDLCSQGQCSKYTYCVAENEEENPWEPFHVEKGFSLDTSTVTVDGVEGPHNLNDHVSASGKSLLITLAAGFGGIGSNSLSFQTGEPVLCLGTEHAHLIARDGYSKADVKEFIFENSAVHLTRLSPENQRRHLEFPERYGPPDEKGLIHMCKRPEDIIVIVVGGAGKHSCCMPTFGGSTAVALAIELAANSE
ncbi:MAG: hypothetical protein HYX92_15220 [Chloroflexi bacterium]|nr:hypothetical protein [Chloroflexota bacterium]